MDVERFDRWTRGLDGVVSRRGLSGLAAGALVAFGLTAVDGDAKRKKKKKKKYKKGTPRPQCAAEHPTCTAGAGCCSETCCLEGGAASGGPMFCAAAGSECCTADEGGGACPPESPVCCDETVPGGCATEEFPVCCAANGINAEPYACQVDAVCCDTGSGCCLTSLDAAGQARARAHSGRVASRR